LARAAECPGPAGQRPGSLLHRESSHVHCESRICTSHVERSNWTLRGHLRRFTRLSNGFSRKKVNLRAALALYFAYYNFVRFHKSIRMTPAMAAGIARKPWSLADLLAASMAS
jgi:hypothetical protein